MRLASIRQPDGELTPAVVTSDSAIPLPAEERLTMREIIERSLERTLETVARQEQLIPLADAVLGPPLPEPRNIICVGKNYPLHAAEEGSEVPQVPLLFGKHTSSLTGPFDEIHWRSTYTGQVDWEAELAVVIGRQARHIPPSAALDHVFGYTVANDVSARDLQFRDGQWLRAKSLESFLPIGPTIVTADEIPDPQHLDIRCRVNGEVKQAANTSEMYHSVAEVISFCSHAFTLLPGDIILTGTPAGVGVFRDPPEFLQHGDTVEVEIEKVGTIMNVCRVVDD